MKCPKCNAEIPESSKFCLECGCEIENKEFFETENDNCVSIQNPSDASEQPPARSVDIINKQNKRKNIFILSLTILLLLAIVFISILSYTYLIPRHNYNTAEQLFNNQEYDAAMNKYLAAREFGDAADKAKLSEKASHYKKAEDAVSVGDLATAKDEFLLAEDYNDALERYHYVNATCNLAEGNYKDAIDEFVCAQDYSDSKDKIQETYYLMGENYLNDKKYSLAIDAFKQSLNYKDSSDKRREANYKLGLVELGSRRFDSARTCFYAANKYENSEELIKVCNAENNISSGNLRDAINTYSQISSELTIDGFNISERIALLNKYSQFASICGVWKASENYIETRQFYRRDGSSKAWSRSELIPSQQLTVKCFLNDDGTATIEGSVSFYHCTNYSLIAQYVKSSSLTRDFKIESVSSIPQNHEVDENTSLEYTDGIFTIQYSKTDEYSTYFYNVYKSSVTYGELDS